MSEQFKPGSPLMYETPPRVSTSGKRTAAWISLLVVGILYGLGGLCMAGGTFMVGAIMQRVRVAGAPGAPGAGGGPAVPPNFTLIMIITGVVMLLVMWAVAAVYTGSAFLVRRGSRAAAVTSLVVAIINAVGILGLVCLGTIGMLSGAGRIGPQALLGLLFYLLPAGANVWLAIAMKLVLRERRMMGIESRLEGNTS